MVDTDRRRGRSRTRVLYSFRTPPGVKIGRVALDDDAMRLIEQLNPDVQFDWPRLLKGQGQPVSEPRVPHEARRQRQDRRPQPRPHHAPPPHVPATQAKAVEDVPAEPAVQAHAQVARPTPVPSQELAPAVVEQVPVVEVPPEFIAPVFDDTPTPAHGRLGVEGVQRLRSRFAEILRRIPERTQEPARREELRQQAERLNPDSWPSDEAVTQGLEQYEAVLASLKELVGQKRRRRRRGKGRTGSEARGDGSDASASTADWEDGGSANDSTHDEGGREDAAPEGQSSDGES